MFELQFQQLLAEYKDALDNRARFTGLVKDYFPGQQMQINLLISAYDTGIAKEIENATGINNAFAFRFVKRLMDEYGISRVNADWAVSVWCVCYGRHVLHKACDIKIQEKKAGAAAPAIQEDKRKSLTYGDLFTYERLQDGTSGVSGFNGDNNRILIFPNKHGNTDVTEIKEGAFAESPVEEAIMTEGYITIGEKAFHGCISLRQIIFPVSLKRIGDFALAGCRNLSTAVLPAMLEQIGSYALSGTGLKNLELPKSVYWIGEGAFSDCRNIRSVRIPENISDIPAGMFNGCVNIEKAELHENLSSIGQSAFRGCSSLMTVYVPDSVMNIGEYAFADTHEKFILQCSFGSYAEEYARSNKLNYQLI